MRTAAKRDDNESEIIDALQKAGWVVKKVSDTGIPDLVCMRNRIVALIEVKMPGGKLTEAQREFFKVVPDKAPVFIVHSAEQALHALGEW